MHTEFFKVYKSSESSSLCLLLDIDVNRECRDFSLKNARSTWIFCTCSLNFLILNYSQRNLSLIKSSCLEKLDEDLSIISVK